jgi:acyl carrier protein
LLRCSEERKLYGRRERQKVMSEAAVRAAIAEHLGVPVERVVDEAEFRALGADSLDLIEMTLLLEQQFDVEIPDDEAHWCTTIGEAIALMREAREARGNRIGQRAAAA